MVNRINIMLVAAALVVLVDLATCQGPPAYPNYSPAQLYGPPQAVPPNVYLHRDEYESKKDKEGYGSKEYKEDYGSKEDKDYEKFDKDEKKFEKEFKKDDKDRKDYDDDKYGEGATTEAPGVLSSISNHMSDAWNRMSSLGRNARALTGAESKNRAISV